MELLLLAISVLAAWLWIDSIGAREIAIQQGRQLAERTHLQLLDETVACSRLRLGRNTAGRVQWLRTYRFEVSASGSERLDCHLTLLGRHLQSWHIPVYVEPSSLHLVH